MDNSIQNVTQVTVDQILAYQKILQNGTAQSTDNTAGLVSDEASGIQKAGQLAKEILQSEESPNLTIDWAKLDTPENAYLAAKSILKYGV